MLFVVADEGAVGVPQGDHVDVLVLLFVVIGVDDVVLRAGREPVHDFLNAAVRAGIVAVEQAAADERRAAVLGVIADGGRVHVDDGMVQVTQDDRCGVLVDDTFEISVQIRHGSPPWVP